jgi:hypothetical protein
MAIYIGRYCYTVWWRSMKIMNIIELSKKAYGKKLTKNSRQKLSLYTHRVKSEVEGGMYFTLQNSLGRWIGKPGKTYEWCIPSVGDWAKTVNLRTFKSKKRKNK